MSLMPMQDNRLASLINPGTQGGGLEQLAQLLMMNQQQRQPQQIPTVNIGGNNLLVKRGQNPLARVGNAGMDALAGLSQNYMGMQQMQKQQQFLQGVQQIASSTKTPDEKINDLVGLTAQHGTDYGMGVKDIVEMYGKQGTREWKPGSKEEALEFEKAKTRDKVEINMLTPAEKRQRNLDTTKAISTFNENKVKKDMIQQAKDAVPKVWTGLVGKARQGWSSALNPNDPMLGEWQKIKMVLTDAQLLHTAHTKGAISDREMELFSKAAANDDVSSIPKIMPVLNKLTRMMDAEEKSMKESYFANYGEQAPVSEEKSEAKQLDKNTAMQFLKQAGGNKQKARSLAQQAGFTF